MYGSILGEKKEEVARRENNEANVLKGDRTEGWGKGGETAVEGSERGRVSSRITFHLVENLFLDGNVRVGERCPAGGINLSEFLEMSRGRVSRAYRPDSDGPRNITATKRISSTRPPSGFSKPVKLWTRVLSLFQPLPDPATIERRIFTICRGWRKWNDDFHAEETKENAPRVYLSLC